MIRDLPLPPSRTSWLADVPVDLGRDEAQDLARRELADPSYDAEPSLLQRAVEWLFEQLSELLSRTTGALSGWVGVAVLGGLRGTGCRRGRPPSRPSGITRGERQGGVLRQPAQRRRVPCGRR